MITEGDGWPRIFEDAIIARENYKKVSPSDMFTNTIPLIVSNSSNPAVKIAESVTHNLTHLRNISQAKSFENIVLNVQVAATYLGIMNMVHSYFDLFILCSLKSTGRYRYYFRERFRFENGRGYE